MSIINPKTNRKVAKYSKTWTNLLKEFDYNEKSKLLVPKNKTNYVFSSTNNQYILKNKINKKYEVKDEQIKLKDIYVKAPTGRIIKKNGNAYKKYIKTGYKIINDIFIKPTETITINKPTYEKLDTNTLKDSKVIIFKIPELDVNITHYFKNKNQFYQWFRNMEYQYEGLENNLEIIKSNDKIKFGVSYDGKLNCFIECVEKHLNIQARKNKLDTISEFYKKYEDGVFEDDINDIANYYKILIRIHENKNVYEYGKEYSKKKTILTLKYNNNHVSNLKEFKVLSTNINETEIIKINPINNYDNLEFNKEYNNNTTIESYLDKFTLTELNNITSIYSDNELAILGIKLQSKEKETIYKYSHCKTDSNELIELKDNEYSLSNKISNEIMDYFTEKPQSIKSDLEITNQLCHNQIFYNHELLKSDTEYKVIDIKNAYDNFGELPTDLLIKINTDKLHNELGFYYITYYCPIRNINISEWRFTEYVKTLQKHNINIKITQAMLSSSKTTLNINELNKKYKKYNKRFFHILLGKWQVYKFQETQITTDYELYNKYGGTKFCINSSNDTYIYKILIDEYNNTNNFYPHIVGAIHEYTNSKLLDTILTFKLKPLRIWIDGIILNEYPKNYPDYFREEMKDYKISYEPLTYDNHKQLDNLTNKYFNLPENKICGIMGSAGVGKSYLINKITKLVKNCHILTPTRIVLRNFETDKKMTYQKYLEDNVKLTSELILIDECTMLNKSDLNKIMLKCNCKIILFGDNKQLPVITGEDIEYNNLNIKYLTKIYRQTDKEFINLLYKTYETGNLNFINSKLTVKECIKDNIIILSSTNDEINRINNIGYKLYKTKKINDTLKVDMPIIIDNLQLKHKGLYTGDTGFIKSYDDKNKTIIINILNQEYKLTEKQLTVIKPAFSITYHRVQGQTINNQICLNLNDIHYFDKIKNNMLYVGISRVKKLSQLSILKN